MGRQGFLTPRSVWNTWMLCISVYRCSHDVPMYICVLYALYLVIILNYPVNRSMSTCPLDIICMCGVCPAHRVCVCVYIYIYIHIDIYMYSIYICVYIYIIYIFNIYIYIIHQYKYYTHIVLACFYNSTIYLVFSYFLFVCAKVHMNWHSNSISLVPLQMTDTVNLLFRRL